jgi:hypothetical protein
MRTTRQLTIERQSVTDSATRSLALSTCQLPATDVQFLTASRSALGILPAKAMKVSREDPTLRGRGCLEGSMTSMYADEVDKRLPVSRPATRSQAGRCPHTPVAHFQPAFSSIPPTPSMLACSRPGICLTPFTSDSVTSLHDRADPGREARVNLEAEPTLAFPGLGRGYVRARARTNKSAKIHCRPFATVQSTKTQKGI